MTGALQSDAKAIRTEPGPCDSGIPTAVQQWLDNVLIPAMVRQYVAAASRDSSGCSGREENE
jgi:hypothetical protein